MLIVDLKRLAGCSKESYLVLLKRYMVQENGKCGV